MHSFRSKALSLVLAVFMALSSTAGVFAEGIDVLPSAIVAQAENEITAVFDEENGMYRYSFSEESEFWTSELLSETGIITSAFWIGTESPDVAITATKNGEPFDMSDAPVLSEMGNYAVEITYSPVDGNGCVLLYEVEIAPPDEVISGETAGNIYGRLELYSDDDGYSYSFGDAGEVWTNVLDGETVSTPAKLLIDEYLYCTVKRDGAVYPLPQNGVISEDGAYSVTVTASHSDGTLETRVLAFNVYINATNRLGIYQPPFGFCIENVLLDGEKYPFNDNYCYFSEDGEYSVTYSNGENVQTVLLVRDTTAPVLYFNGISDIVFDTDVTITADTPCTITAQKNGMPESSDTTLSGNGIYRVTATDQAGNTSSVRIEIRSASMTEALAIAVILSGVIIAALIYYIVQKNKRPVVR